MIFGAFCCWWHERQGLLRGAWLTRKHAHVLNFARRGRVLFGGESGKKILTDAAGGWYNESGGGHSSQKNLKKARKDTERVHDAPRSTTVD